MNSPHTPDPLAIVPAQEPGPPPGTAADATPLLHVRGLVKNYSLEGKEIKVLRGIDRTLWQGEMVSLIGSSGAGKSTLLHVLGTLDKPTEGTVLYLDEDVFRFNEKSLAAFRNRTIGFVFQFHHLLPDFTAMENVMMPALMAGFTRPDAMAQARAILDNVSLSHRLDHRPGELSGGEQQRVAIARALVMRPRIMLADEPTGNLDEETSEEIHNLLFELNSEYNMTLLLVTHHQALARRMKRQWEILGGRIVKDQREA